MVPTKCAVRISRPQASRRPLVFLWKAAEFCMTPATARGCSAWRYSARTPAIHIIGSPCICQVTERGPKSPGSPAITAPPSRSAPYAGHAEADPGDDLALDLVVAAAEGEDDGGAVAAFQFAVQHRTGRALLERARGAGDLHQPGVGVAPGLGAVDLD